MTIEDDEVLKEFLIESYENLDQLDRDFVTLESDPSDRKRIAGIFRTIHTIKGTSGFIGLPKLEALTHVGESLLSKLRDGELTLSPEITSALLAMVDTVRRILASVEANHDEGTEDDRPLIGRLTALGAGKRDPSIAAAPLSKTTAPRPKSGSPEPIPIGQLLIDAGKVSADQVAAALAQQQSDPRRIGEILVEHKSVAPEAVTEALQAQGEQRQGASEASVRVDVGLLDKLMNLVGELVLARNQILQYSATAKDSSFLSTTQRLNLLTSELQEGVMKTRMQPIGNIWNKFPRVVRDLSMACGKQVHLLMEGNETELDRTIVEAIKDPLTHVVRNAVDHGIESPEARAAADKTGAGTLLLRAFHEGGQVNIEIVDDGAGIDPARVVAKAIQRGILTAERAQRLSEREILNLIFLPGFSTAEKVTNVSGRGVGMDVIKTNVEKIGGTVDVSSVLGKGTSIKIKIPLTLAIIPALIVHCGGDRFAIPQVSLLELVRLDGDAAKRSIETVHGAPVYRLRGNLLPLVFLSETLRVTATSTVHDPINIVVLQADDQQFGLVVDGVNDTEEIVVKPLGKELKGISAFSGATIMGDGRVALILDILGVAQRSGVLSRARGRARGDAHAASAARAADAMTLLVYRTASGGRVAVPLTMVARLEELPAMSVERSAGKPVVQYRGQILPLVDLRENSPDRDKDAPLQVIVYSEGGRSVGLVVDQIVDIVEEAVTIKKTGNKHGFLGAIVVQGHVTDLLDVREIIRAADPDFFDQTAA